MKEYIDYIEKKVNDAYELAGKARAKGFDPVDVVEIPLARNMAERVEGLISSVAPQVKGSGIAKRIHELEEEYGVDWRVAYIVAKEVAQEHFCKFENKLESMEIGLRVGLAYLTNGVVASPLEGFTKLELKKTKEGKEYFCLYFSGPIRSAGTTATCAFVALADYVRHELGYAKYDPTEIEVKRNVLELIDFHEKVTNLQYMPSDKELIFMTENLPVQIDGDPSEKFDVSNYKDLDRIKANRLRNGVCLVFGEGLTQKAKKFWGIFSKWYKDFDMGDWEFVEDFVKLQTSIKAKEKKEEINQTKEKIKPDHVYIKDIVAGRPVLGHPLRNGAFRLRYGRARNTGLSGTAISPATMVVLDDYIAIGTQLKWERPGKATVVGSCDSIEGPIVKLNNGDVVYLDNYIDAKECVKDIEEIIYLGDVLIPYGDFLDRGHILVPPGYCEEWWLQELKSKIKNPENFNIKIGLKEEIYNNLLKDFNYKISFDDAKIISEKLGVALHPRFTFHWKSITKEMLKSLLKWMEKGSVKENKIILPFSYDIKQDIEEKDSKRVLELLGVPHKVVGGEYITIEDDSARALIYCLNYLDFKINKDDVLEIINDNIKIKIKDKNGIFIGARMGRPEKGKMRKLTGSPHVLFPVGEEGGRLRSFNTTLDRGYINSQFPIFKCDKCDIKSVYPYCIKCNRKAKKLYLDKGVYTEDSEGMGYENLKLDIKEYFDNALSFLGKKQIPELIKGVRGTSNEDHTPENLIKGILRANNGIYVNKDGTVRFDMIEVPITAFKPKEIGTPIEKLKELGYEKDMEGNDLINEDQVLELRPQDVILPNCESSDQEGADEIFYRVGNFIDGLLDNFYGLDKYYNFKDKNDLVGHLVVALAPHISAGTIGRIIGFSKTQGFYAHPFMHCAVRRDCFDYNTYFLIKENGFWKNVKIGDLVEKLNPEKIVDSFRTKEKKVNGFETVGLNKKVKINNFTKHTEREMIEIKTSLGKKISVTENHKFLIRNEIKRASDLKIGDRLPLIRKIDIKSKNIQKINLIEFLKDENLMVRGIRDILGDVKLSKILSSLKITQKQFMNHKLRDSYPIKFVLELDKKIQKKVFKKGKLSAKRDNVEVPIIINLEKNLLEVIGLYVAEGYSRTKGGKKGLNQVDIASIDESLKNFVKKTVKKHFGLKPTHEPPERVVFSSKILYLFFTRILKCGSNARTKRIPSLFFNLPLNRLAYLLSGYYEGDGSVSRSDRRVLCDSVSDGLLSDLEFCLARFGIFAKRYEYEKEPGPKLKEFYIRKKRKIPKFKITKLIIGSDFVNYFMKIGFLSKRKKNILNYIFKKGFTGMRINYDKNFVYDPIVSIENIGKRESYCLNVDAKNHLVIANSILTSNCDGDECAVILLMDALLNFSRKYLSAHRGARQDTPLIITPILIPNEVDDMVFNMDIVKEYPLEFYEACERYAYPWDVKIGKIEDRLGKENESYNHFFTHNTSNINHGVRCSSYKSLPTMQEKVMGQMELAHKIRAVDEDGVAELVVGRHFMRDIKGNLRKFSQQQFRCVGCNNKYRRPPLTGSCLKCGGKIIFTVSEGSIIKYLEPSLSLAEKFNLSPYLQQSLDLTKMMVESIFGRDKDKQEGLGKWF